MLSFSHVESPQTLGNTVAVKHQSRAAGLTPKKKSTSNAVILSWCFRHGLCVFVLTHLTFILVCLQSEQIEAGILNMSGARHVSII